MRVQVELNVGEDTIFITGTEGLPVPAVGDAVSYHGQDITTKLLVVTHCHFHYEPFAAAGGVFYVGLDCEERNGP